MASGEIRDTAEKDVEKMQNLMQEAIEHINKAIGTTDETNKINFAFDPQGRVMIELPKRDENGKALDNTVQAPFENTVLVSFDVRYHNKLNQAYKQRLIEAVSKEEADPERVESIVDRFILANSGSLIALQQEFYHHLALACRVYQKAVPAKLKGKESQLEAAHRAAMLEVNQLVMAHLAKALKEEYHPGAPFSLAKINKSLDKARKDIAPQAHTLLMKHMVSSGCTVLTPRDFAGEKRIGMKNHAETTTSLPNEILHLQYDGLATLIGGSAITAHDRRKGAILADRPEEDILADRQVSAHPIDNQGVIGPNVHPRIQIRVPSPVMKKGLVGEGYIRDVAFKLEGITRKYELNKHIEAKLLKVDEQVEAKPVKAFIYHSLTAFNDRIDDLTPKNLQTKSAKDILRGAHYYNSQQQSQGDQGDPVFCFVQNISVNGFGDHLGYRGNKLKKETTLMAEVALLHTLHNHVSEDDQRKIENVIHLYSLFLQSSDFTEGKNFFESKQGQGARFQIERLKISWQQAPFSAEGKTTPSLVANSLKKLMAFDGHFSHDYAKLTQTLSVYLAEASIYGCKSGNERAQAIAGRVAILDELANSTNKQMIGGEKITKALRVLSEETRDIRKTKTAKVLKDAIDKSYNAQGLQSALSLISLVDQAATAKVEGKPDSGLYISRNYAEEIASVMFNLFQSKAGKMQAHKGLVDLMIGAWKGHPKGWWVRMKSSPLGIIGGILGCVTVVPAVIVAGYSVYDNRTREKKADAIKKAALNKDESDLNKNESNLNKDDPKNTDSQKGDNSEFLSYQIIYSLIEGSVSPGAPPANAQKGTPQTETVIILTDPSRKDVEQFELNDEDQADPSRKDVEQFELNDKDEVENIIHKRHK